MARTERGLKPPSSFHWSEIPEHASRYWHVKLLDILFKRLPMTVIRILTFPVALSYFIVAKRARAVSRMFLTQMAAFLEKDPENSGGKRPKLSSFTHIRAFAMTVVEKVEAWGGKVGLNRIHFQDDDIGDLIAVLEQGRGALLICSHLGNTELLRALACFNRTGVSRNVPVNSIVDFSIVPYFSRMLKELNPQSMLNLISANHIGPETIMRLEERAAAGELVVIAGDRTSAHARNKYFLFPFLGKDAPFAVGPFFLAALLNVPTYFVFALRQQDVSLSSHFEMHVHKSPVSFDAPRKERNQKARELARAFAERLEYYCKQRPHQWYNFYDFWAVPEESEEQTR
jgi:predicted LPLAT superfamily acyltransferase